MEYLQYYKKDIILPGKALVLNLIINGIPSILAKAAHIHSQECVLNLIINGIPSIRWKLWFSSKSLWSFKPYYKWNTFNTFIKEVMFANHTDRF